MPRLAFITDEATQSLDEAIAFALEHGLDGVELRSVEDTPVDRISVPVLRQYRRRLADAHLAVCDLASSFFKCRPEDAPGEMEKLARLCDAADALDCVNIRGFAFFAGPAGPAVTEEMVALFAPALALVKSRGKRLLLEADPSVNTTSHAALAALLARLDDPAAGAIFDPGNDLYDPGGETPWPDGYQAVRPWLCHVHIKDAVREADGSARCVRVGEGAVDYPGLLRALRRDGYDGWLSLETHYRKQTVISEQMMRQPGGTAFSAGGMEATAESVAALRRLLAEAEEDTP